MEFKSWKAVEEYNNSVDNPIYCAAQLSKMGLKPKDKNRFEIHAVYKGMGRGWDNFKFYTLDNTAEKRKVTRIVKEYQATTENLCQALYIVNKSAKKSRDTAQECYNNKRHGNAAAAKKRKNALYEIKDVALKKMIANNIGHLVGYNTQTVIKAITEWHSTCDICEHQNSHECQLCEDEQRWNKVVKKEITNYLLLYAYESFSFHIPVEKKPDNVEYLNHIDELISKEVTVKCSIGFNDAVKLLSDYCQEESKLKKR